MTAPALRHLDAREIGLSLTHTLASMLTHLVSLVPTGLTGSGFFKAACLWSNVVSAV